jgi:hypothetical protein
MKRTGGAAEEKILLEENSRLPQRDRISAHGADNGCPQGSWILLVFRPDDLFREFM